MSLTNSEDIKLLTLAKSSLQRNSATQSAALRDGTGRTHVGNSITLTSLKLDALEVALAMAISSGADQIEAAVLVGVSPSANAVLSVREISPHALVWYAQDDGSLNAL